MVLIFIYLLVVLALVGWIESEALLGINSLIIKRNSGEELEQWLKGFHWDRRRQEGAIGELPRYKFYTETIETLLNFARKMGGQYQESFLFLREGLLADGQFEKRVKEAIGGCWIQMGFMILLTWGFISAALFLTGIKVSVVKLLVIASWQGLGLIFLPISLRKLRLYYFGEIGKLWKMLYILRSLHCLPLARSEIFKFAGVGELENIKQKQLFDLVGKMKLLCQKTLQEGGSYSNDLQSLMSELRFQEKWHFELFEKRLNVVKLGLLSLFFLPSYLGFVFMLLNDLLTLM